MAIIGTTPSGVNFEIDEARLDNMELVDALAEVEAGNVIAISKVSALLLGGTLKAEIYKAIKAANGGRVPTEALTSDLAYILNAKNNEIKK